MELNKISILSIHVLVRMPYGMRVYNFVCVDLSMHFLYYYFPISFRNARFDVAHGSVLTHRPFWSVGKVRFLPILNVVFIIRTNW